MVAHSQFCFSGDHTVEAAEAAIKNVYESFGDPDEGSLNSGGDSSGGGGASRFAMGMKTRAADTEKNGGGGGGRERTHIDTTNVGTKYHSGLYIGWGPLDMDGYEQTIGPEPEIQPVVEFNKILPKVSYSLPTPRRRRPWAALRVFALRCEPAPLRDRPALFGADTDLKPRSESQLHRDREYGRRSDAHWPCDAARYDPNIDTQTLGPLVI